MSMLLYDKFIVIKSFTNCAFFRFNFRIVTTVKNRAPTYFAEAEDAVFALTFRAPFPVAGY